MDALLHAAKETLRGADLGYSVRDCDVMADGRPPPAFGDIFLAVHQHSHRSTMRNAKNDLYSFCVTLTMRVSDVPYDRIGDTRLAVKLAQETGFNRRCNRIANRLHMAWDMLQIANQYMVDVNPEATTVYGFGEPALFDTMETPRLVGGEWFFANPEAQDVALVSELLFSDARRLQPIGNYT